MHTIIVQIADRQWTERAMHRACQMAQQYEAQIVLLWLTPIPNPRWLGAELNEPIIPPKYTNHQAVYMAIAKDYAVDYTLQRVQYFTLEGALINSANQLNAQVVFAQLPKSVFACWDKLRLWSLKRRLATHNRQLYTPDGVFKHYLLDVFNH